MPGVSLVWSRDPLPHDQLARSRSELTYRDEYRVKEYLSNEYMVVAVSGYDSYPCLSYEDEDLLLLVEGMIYNRTDDETLGTLRSIAADYKRASDPTARIRTFVETSDGEFLILLYLKETGDLYVLNDRWARMPTFYAVLDDKVVLSREAKFVLRWMPSIKFDPAWIAEFLAFEYNLGDKCLVNGVKSLRASSLLRVCSSNGRLRA